MEILSANDLANPNNLPVGMVLVIPGYEDATVQTVESEPSEPYEYEVQAGDTLFSLAQQFDTSAAEIAAANDLANLNNLPVGTVLVIPGYVAGGQGNARVGSASTIPVHTVRAGETLSGIAQRYGVEMAEIVSANNLTNPNVLEPGQELLIPGITVEEFREVNQLVHVVAAGERLSGIAQRYGVSTEAIVEANDLDNPNRIAIGQRLVIPEP